MRAGTSVSAPPSANALSTKAAPFVASGGVVRVDLRRLRVGVAQPLLNRPQRRTGGGHLRAEGVAQLVEGEAAKAGALERLVEALAERRGVVGAAGDRMAEDEVVIGAKCRALEVPLEFPRQTVRHRDG